jgi:transposase
MVKYTEQQKLDAVKAYESGAGGLRATAEAQGVSFDSLRVWVAQFRARGAAGVVTKKRSSYDFEFKLAVLRRMNDEGLSSRQASALFDIRRLDQVAEWSRLYADHGAEALRPGWKKLQSGMNKKPIGRVDAATPGDDQRSREDLVRDLQQLRMENAYLKKAHALVRAKTRSAPKKGR